MVKNWYFSHSVLPLLCYIYFFRHFFFAAFRLLLSDVTVILIYFFQLFFQLHFVLLQYIFWNDTGQQECISGFSWSLSSFYCQVLTVSKLTQKKQFTCKTRYTIVPLVGCSLFHPVWGPLTADMFIQGSLSLPFCIYTSEIHLDISINDERT